MTLIHENYFFRNRNKYWNSNNRVDRPVCKSEDSKDIRLRSSILINVKQKNILIDCSPDFRQQMLNNNFSKIDAILFTHEHSDHTAGLDDVRPISFKYGKIPLFGKKEF